MPHSQRAKFGSELRVLEYASDIGVKGGFSKVCKHFGVGKQHSRHGTAIRPLRNRGFEHELLPPHTERADLVRQTLDPRHFQSGRYIPETRQAYGRGLRRPLHRLDKAELMMDTKPAPFVPPAPTPRSKPPSMLEMIRIVYRNPLELWGEPSYNEPWISVTGIGGPLVIANDPGLIRHVLVDNAKNYKLATVRQMILRPILRDGLLTAEGDGLEALAQGDGAGVHAAPHFRLRRADAEAQPRPSPSATRDAGSTVDVAHDMTTLTYDILAETLFSGEIAGEPGSFGSEIDRLFETMGRVDPLDLLRAPDWLPRITRLRGRKTMAYFRKIVADTVDDAQASA